MTLRLDNPMCSYMNHIFTIILNDLFKVSIATSIELFQSLACSMRYAGSFNTD